MGRRVLVLLPLLLVLVGGDCDDDDDDIVFFIVKGPSADLDVDGHADLVIGAPLHDGGGAPGAQRGAVFIHYGGPGGPSPAPGLAIFGSEDGAQLGASLALVGDVNLGGAPDLLVGAPFDDGDGNASDDGLDRGRAFVFFGGPDMDAIPDVTMTGAEEGGLFGWSVARIPDPPGYEDWIVGAPLDDGDGNASDDGLDRGRAFFFFGGPFPDGVPDLTLTGTEQGSGFGTAVASAGDLNRGGADDLAVGAPLDDGDGNASDEGLDRGRVFVFYGGSFLDPVPDLVFTGDEDGAELGSAVARLNDVSGDDTDDLGVGAPAHDAGGGAGADRGAGFVFFGASAPDTTADLVLEGSSDGGAFGAALARAGDVDGDGGRDFLVGAPLEDPGGRADAGRAYLFRGGAALDDAADLVLAGAEAGAEFGAAVAGPGDVAGGGRDLAIGAPGDDADGDADDDGFDRGSVFVFDGGAALDDIPDVIVDGAQDQALLGAALAQ